MIVSKSGTRQIEMDNSGHGGDLDLARQQFGRRRFLDLSVNINPWGPPWRAWITMLAALSGVRCYPQPYAAMGRAELARFFRLDETQVALGNGAAELIRALAFHPDFKRALVLEPTFSEYRLAFAAAGKRVVVIPLAPEFTLPVDEITTKLKAGDLLFICQPNNPTGRLFAAEELVRIIEIAHRTGAWVALDESFLWFCGEIRRLSFKRYLTSFPRLIVLNSLTKIGSIPGLRLGFAAADPEMAAFCRNILPQWNLNSLAQRVIPAVLNEKFLRRSRLRIERERQWLSRQFTRIPGVLMLKSEANFYLVQLETPAVKAIEVIERLGRRGILVRDASNFPNIPPECLRVAIGRRRQNRRFLKTLKEIMGK